MIENLDKNIWESVLDSNNPALLKMPAKVFPGVRIQAAVSDLYTTRTTACVGMQVRGFSLGSSFLGPVSLTSAIRLEC